MWTGAKEWQTLEERQERVSPLEPLGQTLADALISPLYKPLKSHFGLQTPRMLRK